MTSRDQTLRELIYMIFHSAGIGVQKIADHKNVMFGLTKICIATVGTTKRITTDHAGSLSLKLSRGNCIGSIARKDRNMA